MKGSCSDPGNKGNINYSHSGERAGIKGWSHHSRRAPECQHSRANDLVKGRGASLSSAASSMAPGAGSAVAAAAVQVEPAGDCRPRGCVPAAVAGAPGARGGPGKDVPQLTAAALHALGRRAMELGGCSLAWPPLLRSSMQVLAKHLLGTLFCNPACKCMQSLCLAPSSAIKHAFLCKASAWNPLLPSSMQARAKHLLGTLVCNPACMFMQRVCRL